AKRVERSLRGCLFCLCCVFFPHPTAAAVQATADTGAPIADTPSPLASSDELARRTQTPITYDRLRRYVAQTRLPLIEQTVDPSSEHFEVYVPRRRPPSGYGLMVWIPPQEEGQPAPRAWRPELDRRGIIYVAARKSGNTQNLLERRLPLVLHAAHNVMRRYQVDPARVYVGGFSGGGRSALRLAVAYPDLFRGALLNAGSDVIGQGLTLPSAELVDLFRSRSRLVYVTGALDLPNRRMESHSMASAEGLCAANLGKVSLPHGVGHAPPDARAFAKAMELIESPPQEAAPDCVLALAGRIAGELDEIQRLIARNDLHHAGERLAQADQRWGGLAAPRSVQLAHQLVQALEARE
ncbi:MAG: PHB depolymerase family esterase, partial [Pseudoxanthomonas sp.]